MVNFITDCLWYIQTSWFFVFCKVKKRKVKMRKTLRVQSLKSNTCIPILLKKRCLSPSHQSNIQKWVKRNVPNSGRLRWVCGILCQPSVSLQFPLSITSVLTVGNYFEILFKYIEIWFWYTGLFSLVYFL